jgi:hypothetical protein
MTIVLEAVTASAVDCSWPSCKTTDSNGDDTCSKGYPCTGENDRVSHRIGDPAVMPADARATGHGSGSSPRVLPVTGARTPAQDVVRGAGN